MKQTRSFVGMDVHKATISISVAEDVRTGPVRFLGVIPNTSDDVAKMAKRLSRHGELDFCYEASCCGYGIYRQLTALGHRCIVAAPSLIPRKAGERIKTDRRDSEKLAMLHRRPDAGLGSGHDARSASRPCQSSCGRIDASDACAAAVTRISAAAWAQLPDRQALDATASQLACWTDLPGARSWHRLSRLPGDRLDSATETRCPDREDYCDGGELVVRATCRSITRIARHRHDLGSDLHRIHRRPKPL
jgi:hypothetical protein